MWNRKRRRERGNKKTRSEEEREIEMTEEMRDGGNREQVKVKRVGANDERDAQQRTEKDEKKEETPKVQHQQREEKEQMLRVCLLPRRDHREERVVVVSGARQAPPEAVVFVSKPYTRDQIQRALNGVFGLEPAARA